MNFFSYLILANACVTGFLSLYAFRFRTSRVSLYFSLLMMAVTIYSVGYAFELSGETYRMMRFWLYFEYLGIPFIPSLWLLFTLQYLGKTEWLRTPFLVLYLGISLLTLIFHYTNNLHHLFYKDVQMDNSGDFPVLILSKGIWYWVHMAYFNLVVLLSTILFAHKLIRAPILYRRQYMLMLAGTIIPWIGNTLYILGAGPAGIDLNPFSGMITGIFFGWGIFAFHLLDIVPVAFENIFESMRDGVIVLDLQKRILHFNPAAARNLGCLNYHSVGKPLLQEIEPLQELKLQLQKYTASNFDFTVHFENPPGFFHFSMFPVTDRRRKEIGYILLMSDITEQMITEQTLKKNETEMRELNATKDKLISIMAHDLRNPFVMISSLVSLMADPSTRPQNKELDDIMIHLQDVANNANAVLENLLLWTRAQTGKLEFNPQTFNFTELVSETVNHIRTGNISKELSFRIDIPTRFEIIADKNMLATVIRNLLSNAAKFSKTGGVITIAAKKEMEGIRIQITDQGIGMNPQELSRLFTINNVVSKPGTSGEKGSGFGLLICREFVGLHQGQISAVSEPNKGSSFIIILPQSPDTK